MDDVQVPRNPKIYTPELYQPCDVIQQHVFVISILAKGEG
jgi:hypothetical protein